MASESMYYDRVVALVVVIVVAVCCRFGVLVLLYPYFTGILASHNMTSYELSRFAVDVGIIHKLERHVM